VVQGACRLYYTRPDGEEKTTYFFFENHLMASYISCLTGQPSPFGIQALEPTELLTVPYAVLSGLFEEWPVYERFARLVAEYHLLGTDARLAELLLLSPEQRYRNLLVSSKHKILARIPQQYIASYLGVTPVSLSRIRARVQAEDGPIS
jgi:CRP-like cAMP-binding protein